MNRWTYIVLNHPSVCQQHPFYQWYLNQHHQTLFAMYRRFESIKVWSIGEEWKKESLWGNIVVQDTEWQTGACLPFCLTYLEQILSILVTFHSHYHCYPFQYHGANHQGYYCSCCFRYSLSNYAVWFASGYFGSAVVVRLFVVCVFCFGWSRTRFAWLSISLFVVVHLFCV